MGLYDRDYTQEHYQHHYRGGPQMRLGFPQMTPVVKWLLIINVAVFFMQVLGGDELLVRSFSVYPFSFVVVAQFWRLITYQFLHGGVWHLAFNMLGLFFLGPTLERHWKGKKFLTFYLGCGVAGGLFYILLAVAGFLPIAPMIGASGAILGMLAACAILFPQFIVFIFLFPVPIRVAAVVLIIVYTANLLMAGANAGGDAAHLAGMAAGAVYVLSQSWRDKLKLKARSGQWQKKIETQRDLQAELDRVLQKVHDYGIQSLTAKEKKTLKQATKAQQTKNRL